MGSYDVILMVLDMGANNEEKELKKAIIKTLIMAEQFLCKYEDIIKGSVIIEIRTTLIWLKQKDIKMEDMCTVYLRLKKKILKVLNQQLGFRTVYLR